MRKIVVISGPSGSGKSTLIEKLLRSEYGRFFCPVPSTTTRSPRQTGEAEDIARDQRNYIFVSQQRFQEMIAAGELVEWAEVHGQLYGKAFAAINEALGQGTPIMEIDTQGYQKVCEHYRRRRIVSVFLRPATFAELEERLRQRGNNDDIETRLATAREEWARQDEYDHIIISETPEKSLKELISIVVDEI